MKDLDVLFRRRSLSNPHSNSKVEVKKLKQELNNGTIDCRLDYSLLQAPKELEDDSKKNRRSRDRNRRLRQVGVKPFVSTRTSTSPSGFSGAALRQRFIRQASHLGEAAERFMHWTLLQFHHLPEWMKDNEFIHTCHRPQLNNFLACLRTIFMFHTETVNIWTHLIGFIGFLVITVYSMSHPDLTTWEDRTVYLMFFLGAICCLGFSWMFHTMHCHSQHVSKFFNKLDYAGISFLILGSFVPYVYYAFYCHLLYKVFYLSLITALSLVSLAISMLDRFGTPQFRNLRAFVFVMLGISGVIPCSHHIALEGFMRALQEASLGWLVLMAVLYISGAAIYALRVPERFAPGRFDIWFQSHQIFHVFVVVAALVHLHGINTIALFRSNTICYIN